jgi:putative pyruvate formate lyase activating enzyme
MERRFFFQSFFHLIISGLASLFGFVNAGNREAGTLKMTQNKAPQIMEDFQPGYLKLSQSGELKKRGEILWNMMASCSLCPRECGAERLQGERGFCEASSTLEIASYHPHFGEETPLVGKGGSGTIFFSNCNLRCVFCINWEISQGGEGTQKSIDDLAEMMLYLQRIGCLNINVVTPTHYAAHIVLALNIAAKRGLKVPFVYNTCGWEKIEILKLLDGIVDVYLPDYKYSDSRMAAKYSSDADTYSEMTREALLEMNRQVGVAKPAADGIMYRGLMIRHLVMPNRVSGTKEVIEWISKNLPKDTYLNLMSQYRPMYKAFDYPEISRQLNSDEYLQAIESARKAGLLNLDIQGNI